MPRESRHLLPISVERLERELLGMLMREKRRVRQVFDALHAVFEVDLLLLVLKVASQSLRHVHGHLVHVSERVIEVEGERVVVEV